MMQDPRSLYMSQLINRYRKKPFLDGPTPGYTVNYRCEGDDEDTYLYFDHNKGLDCIQRYIKYLEKNIQELEQKIDELQHVEKIIQAARRSDYE